MTRLDAAWKVLEGLKDGLPHREALKRAAISWKVFKEIVGRNNDLQRQYGTLNGGQSGTLIGFSAVSHLIGRKYRDILPLIANPTLISDAGTMQQALVVAGLLESWIEGIREASKQFAGIKQ